jgi:hypothetical protein
MPQVVLLRKLIAKMKMVQIKKVESKNAARTIASKRYATA